VRPVKVKVSVKVPAELCSFLRSVSKSTGTPISSVVESALVGKLKIPEPKTNSKLTVIRIYIRKSLLVAWRKVASVSGLPMHKFICESEVKWHWLYVITARNKRMANLFVLTAIERSAQSTQSTALKTGSESDVTDAARNLNGNGYRQNERELLEVMKVDASCDFGLQAWKVVRGGEGDEGQRGMVVHGHPPSPNGNGQMRFNSRFCPEVCETERLSVVLLRPRQTAKVCEACDAGCNREGYRLVQPKRWGVLHPALPDGRCPVPEVGLCGAGHQVDAEP